MIPGFHGIDLIVILVIALLIFGPKKLPELGSGLGKAIKDFKHAINDSHSEQKPEVEKDAPAQISESQPK